MAESGWLPVPLFCAGGIATPADAALVMQLGAEGNFVGSGIFKSEDPERRARAIVEATTHFKDPERVAAASMELGSRCAATTSRSLRPRASCCSSAGLSVAGDTRRRPGFGRRPDCELACWPARATSRPMRRCSLAGREPVEVRTAEELDDLDGLVIPGGESTTIAKAIERDGLEPAIRAHADVRPARSWAPAPG